MSGLKKNKNKGPHPDESVVRKKKKKKRGSDRLLGQGEGPGYFYYCLLRWPLPKCFLLWSCLMLTILSCDFYGSLWSWSCILFCFFICMSPVKDLGQEKKQKNTSKKKKLDGNKDWMKNLAKALSAWQCVWSSERHDWVVPLPHPQFHTKEDEGHGRRKKILQEGNCDFILSIKSQFCLKSRCKKDWIYGIK